jgi:hypothetical protein
MRDVADGDSNNRTLLARALAITEEIGSPGIAAEVELMQNV